MRCKRHPCEPGSVGVCASCLRERLLALLAAQAKEAESQREIRKPDPPPPLVFPRSVSPYTSRRSTNDPWHYDHYSLFYSTPQVGPTFGGSRKGKGKGKKNGRFSFLKSIFGSSSSRSGEIEADPRASRAQDESQPYDSSPSWFSAILPRGGKKKSRLFSLEDEISGCGGRRSCAAMDRGMSPSANSKGKRDVECELDDSPIGSGYSSESSTGWRKSVSLSAVPAPRRRGALTQQSRNVSGFAFCLSPLVRASPNRHHHRHETVSSGEIRNANRHHLATAASLCTNRSRKLADFGRYP